MATNQTQSAQESNKARQPFVMGSFDSESVLQVLKAVPARYRGPGGALAVLKDGNLVAQHVWGYADMDRRIPITDEVLFPMCSITKQFVSALLHDLSTNPPPLMTGPGSFQEQMLARLREVLPAGFVDDAGLTVENLIDMCSGLRDYWALCTLQGSRPDTVYSIHKHNPDMLSRIKSLQFEPGNEYSYSNTNFNIVERLLEHVTRNNLDNLLHERIFAPAGMKTARLCPRTDRLPAPIVGYEGNEKFGFFPAPNFIEWSADAGLVASLADMIAYERSFDKKFLDANSSYRDTIQLQQYKNGARAKYRYGLKSSKIQGLDALGHGGGLRGFRLYRLYIPDIRLSVIVLFNHHADSYAASEYIVKQLLHSQEPSYSIIQPAKEWFGAYLDEQTQLAVRVMRSSASKVSILYARSAETLKLVDGFNAQSDNISASVDGNSLRIHRMDDNRILSPKRLTMIPKWSDRMPIQGSYKCAETGSTFICEGEGEMPYALFNGCFGCGPAHLMTYLGNKDNEEVWVFANPRAMDDSPPGDWTLVFLQDEKGVVSKVTIGCWLARKLEFFRCD